MTDPAPREETSVSPPPFRWSRILVAAVAAALAFLPIVNWIGGGHAAPWYHDVLQTWMSGSVIVAGAVVLLVVLTRQRVLGATDTLAERVARSLEQRWTAAVLLLAAVAALLYAFMALRIFGGQPIFIDEIVQAYQARLLASGRLSENVGPFPEFFGALNVVSAGDRQFGQFPPGGPAHLVPGIWLGATWPMTPLLGAASVVVFGMLVRRIERDTAIAAGAVLLFALSPFMVFMSASHMNHVPALFWILMGWLAAVRVRQEPARSVPWMALLGFAAAMATTIRPLDAVLLSAPVGLYTLWITRHGRWWVPLGAAVAGAAVPLMLLLAYNAATTGAPLLFGYELLWGRGHGLGFHESPWGYTHTPARGIELLNLYLLRLQSYLYESPLPALLPALVAIAFFPRLAAVERVIGVGGLLLAAGYAAYWHDGFYLGPRFFFALLPLLALWTARAPAALGALTGSMRVRQSALLVLVVGVALGLATGLPERAAYHARSLRGARAVPLAAVDSLGIDSAIIFVRESWGSQVLARLWGLAVDRPAAERLYRGVDTCRLDSAVTALESDSIRGSAARDALWPLLADSARVLSSTLSPDRTERMQDGVAYSASCLAQVARDRAGFSLYPLVLTGDRRANVYARDLGERNQVLLQRHPGRAAYLLLPVDSATSAFRLERIER